MWDGAGRKCGWAEYGSWEEFGERGLLIFGGFWVGGWGGGCGYAELGERDVDLVCAEFEVGEAEAETESFDVLRFLFSLGMKVAEGREVTLPGLLSTVWVALAL